MANNRVVLSPTDAELAGIALTGKTPRLLLHCCCAPCASYVLEYLSPYFSITILYFNPNITSQEEYDKRGNEFYKLPIKQGYPNRVDLQISKFDTTAFMSVAASLENEPEGGRRCLECFRLRLGGTVLSAKENGYDYFCTTLSVSPFKNAALLNEIGNSLAAEFRIKYLTSDFKKRDGYKRSVELSALYGLYRQTYCGCGM